MCTQQHIGWRFTCQYEDKCLYVVFVTINAEEYDAYIIVSFTNATLVLSIGETVEEITNSGFLGTTPTLAAHQLGEDALLQVEFVRVILDHVILFCLGLPSGDTPHQGR